MYCRLLCSVTTCNWNRYYYNINLYYLSNRCGKFCSRDHLVETLTKSKQWELLFHVRVIWQFVRWCLLEIVLSSSSTSAWSTFAEGGDRAFLGYCSAAKVGTWLLVVLLLRTKSAALAMDPESIFPTVSWFWSVKINFERFFDKRAKKRMGTNVGQAAACWAQLSAITCAN